MSHLVPSVTYLPAEMMHLVHSALLLQTEFNFAQFMQGENLPLNVAILAEIIEEHGEQLLKFYLFVVVCFMSGLTGAISLEGSLFLTDMNASNLLAGVRHLQEIGKIGPESIYWGYVSARAKKLGMGHS